MADLTAGFLLATGVLAALVRARETGEGELVDVSLLAAALAVQLQDLVWLDGEADESGTLVADRSQLAARADEIVGGLAMNPYYRCFEAADGFVAVACLNLTQRRAFLGLFGLDDPTIEAPDLVPGDASVLAAKRDVTAAIARAFLERTVAEWVARLGESGVPSGPVHRREAVFADRQIVAEQLVGRTTQPGFGDVTLLAPFVRIGQNAPAVAPAPELGAHTDEVLGGLA